MTEQTRNERLRMEWAQLDTETKEMLHNYAVHPDLFSRGFAQGYLTALVHNGALLSSHTWFMVVGEIASMAPGTHEILKWGGMKTAELTGAALDWAVAKCEGVEVLQFETAEGAWHTGNWLPSIDWAQGGPIIEREQIAVWMGIDERWHAQKSDTSANKTGETPLIAAMRCYVASKLGDEVELPEELCAD